jgi:DNA oxidative demethylase
MSDLFDAIEPLHPPREVMAEGAVLLGGAALPFETDILTALQAITAQAPFRHMTTPGGYVMSVAMTNCAHQL